MDDKEAIIQATIEMISEKSDRLDEITVREICKKSGVGLGLVNYHFGNKEKLIELCVERIINSIVEQFLNVQEKTEGLFSPICRRRKKGTIPIGLIRHISHLFPLAAQIGMKKR